VIHEGGHFVAAILTGITVKGLYLGIPIPDLPFLPGLVRKLFRKIQLRLRLGKYPFVVSPFLLGAMVDVDEDQLREAHLLKRIAVFLGGPLANFMSLFAVSFLLNGLEGGLAYGWKVITFSAVTPLLILFRYVSTKEILGPVGIVSVSTQILSLGLGFRAAAVLFAVISGALGTFNLFPIPALDGGRVVISILTEFGLPKKWSNILIYGSLVVLLILMAVITVKDVRLFL
jgi:membrane-associated protease RseP (regulator of RpoE activity)